MPEPPWWAGPLGALVGVVAVTGMAAAARGLPAFGLLLFAVPAAVAVLVRAAWSRSPHGLLTSAGTVTGWGLFILALQAGLLFYLTFLAPLIALGALALVRLGEVAAGRAARLALGQPRAEERGIWSARRLRTAGLVLLGVGLLLVGLASWAAQTIQSCQASGPCMTPLIYAAWGFLFALAGLVVFTVGAAPRDGDDSDAERVQPRSPWGPGGPP